MAQPSVQGEEEFSTSWLRRSTQFVFASALVNTALFFVLLLTGGAAAPVLMALAMSASGLFLLSAAISIYSIFTSRHDVPSALPVLVDAQEVSVPVVEAKEEVEPQKTVSLSPVPSEFATPIKQPDTPPSEVMSEQKSKSSPREQNREDVPKVSQPSQSEFTTPKKRKNSNSLAGKDENRSPLKRQKLAEAKVSSPVSSPQQQDTIPRFDEEREKTLEDLYNELGESVSARKESEPPTPLDVADPNNDNALRLRDHVLRGCLDSVSKNKDTTRSVMNELNELGEPMPVTSTSVISSSRESRTRRVLFPATVKCSPANHPPSEVLSDTQASEIVSSVSQHRHSRRGS